MGGHVLERRGADEAKAKWVPWSKKSRIKDESPPKPFSGTTNGNRENGKESRGLLDGHVDLPKLPGLGVEVNKELVPEENKTPHNRKNPVWHHKDGSVAEW